MNSDTPNRNLFNNNNSNNQNSGVRPNNANLTARNNLNTSSCFINNGGATATQSNNNNNNNNGVLHSTALDVRVRQEVQSLTNQRDKLQKELVAANSKITELVSQKQDLANQRAGLNKKVTESETLREKNKSLELRVKEMNDRLNAIQNETNEQVKALQQHENLNQLTIGQWRFKAEKNEEQKNFLERQHQISLDAIKELNDRCRDLETTITLRDQSINSARDDIDKMQSSIESITESRNNAKREAQESKQEYNETLEKLSQKEEEYRRALDAIAVLEDGSSTSEQRFRRDAQEISSLQTKIKQQIDEISNKNKEVAALRVQIDELDARHETGVRDLTISRSETRSVKENASALQQRLDHVESDLGRAKNTENDLREKIAAHKSQFSAQADQLAARIVELESSLTEVASLKTRIKDLEVQLRDKEKFTKELRNESENASTRFGDQEVAILRLEGQIAELQNEKKSQMERASIEAQELRDDIQERNETIARLENQVAGIENSAKNARSDLTNKNEDFATRILNLEALCNDKDKCIAMAAMRFANLQTQFDENNQRLLETGNALSMSQDQLDSARREREGKEAELEALRDNLEQFNTRNRQDAEHNERSFNETKRSAADLIEHISTELGQMRQSNIDKDALIKRAESAADIQKNRVDALARELECTKAELQQVRVELEDANDKANDHRIRHDQVLQRLDEQIASLSQKETDFEDFGRRLAQSQQKERHLDGQISELRAAVEEKENQLQIVECEKGALKNEIGLLEKRVGELGAQIDHLQQEQLVGQNEAANELEKKYNEVQANYTKLRGEHTRLEEQHLVTRSQLQDQVMKLETQVWDAQKSIRSHDDLHASEVDSLKIENSDLRQQITSDATNHKIIVEEMQKSFDEQRARVVELVSLNDRSEKRVKQYKSGYEGAVAKFDEVNALRKKELKALTAFRNQIAGLAAENVQTKKENEELRNNKSNNNNKGSERVIVGAVANNNNNARFNNQNEVKNDLQYYQRHADLNTLETEMSRLSNKLNISNTSSGNSSTNNRNDAKNNNQQSRRVTLRNVPAPNEAGSRREREQ